MPGSPLHRGPKARPPEADDQPPRGPRTAASKCARDLIATRRVSVRRKGSRVPVQYGLHFLIQDPRTATSVCAGCAFHSSRLASCGDLCAEDQILDLHHAALGLVRSLDHGHGALPFVGVFQLVAEVLRVAEINLGAGCLLRAASPAMAWYSAMRSRSITVTTTGPRASPPDAACRAQARQAAGPHRWRYRWQVRPAR